MSSTSQISQAVVLTALAFFVCVVLLVSAVPHTDRPQSDIPATPDTPSPPKGNIPAQAHDHVHDHEHDHHHHHDHDHHDHNHGHDAADEHEDEHESPDDFLGLAQDVVPRELTDDTFEHDTQANTGSTTGKWFIKFYAPWCGHCKSLAPIWDSLAKELHGSDVTIAKLDATVHSRTARRFSVSRYPTLKFIANGEVFDYEGGRTLDELKRFALGGYQLSKPANVPGEPTLWDGFVDSAMSLLKDIGVIFQHKTAAALLVLLVGIASGVIIAVTIFITCCEKSDVPPGCVPVFTRLPDGRLVRSGSMPASQVQQMQQQQQQQQQHQHQHGASDKNQSVPAPSADGKKKQ